MTPIKLHGLDGSHLFGFLATCGLLRLLHQASLKDRGLAPKVSFDEGDYCAMLEGADSVERVEEALWKELRSLRHRLKNDFEEVDKPADLTQLVMDKLAASDDRCTQDELAGLGCRIGEEVHESTLCAANGAGHQNLVLSMRDVLDLLESHRGLLLAAALSPWSLGFEPTHEDRKRMDLGNRKPTLRLDPSDERLYALRLDDPTSKEAAYRTELGAQALAAAAFGGLPVVVRQRYPVTVGSERRGNKVFFYWGLWSVPASYTAIRSFLWAGVRNPESARARGVFATFRAARVAGAKGKLSFAPTEPWW